ncbi:Arginase/deacetylase [Sistotremastrum suecicum HHB10207 ss-3]|uniref:Arginase/deacetylase n=1 Tax=Sistotremastrum suecicum HHB10207 ss-3 TaxID=1314776 RepID=A0A165YEG8_9AGAM|nr:Arginase/deacetylase [Sistotremastrum suecicum HHB10207 ss-3]
MISSTVVVSRMTGIGGRNGLFHALLPLAPKALGDQEFISNVSLLVIRDAISVADFLSVIHYNAHLDTWDALDYPGSESTQAQVTHATFFWLANNEGFLTNTSIHAGIRCKLLGTVNLEHDASVGFELISTDDIDEIGTMGVVERIRERVGDGPVYLSLDIDVIDPGMAPATGTPEAGGWTTREVKRIIKGLAGLNIVGADLVEVAPAYDHAEVTGIAAADIVAHFLALLTLGQRSSHGKFY